MGETERNFEASQEGRFGRNVSVTIEFMRHEVPGKDPVTGMSADFLTEQGQANARAKSKKIDKPVKGYSSPRLRAQETIDLQLQNVDIDENVQVINQRRDAVTASGKTVGEILKSQKTENAFNIRVRPELETATNFAKFMPEAQAWARKQITDGSKRGEYDLIVQYYLDNPVKSRLAGAANPDDSAEEIAFAADREIRMTKRLYNDSDIQLLNASHGPKLEPFLQKILIGRDGKRGFKSLDEIGGALNPGEGFTFTSKTDEHGEQTVKLALRGQEYDVDMEKLGQLAEDYRNHLQRLKNSPKIASEEHIFRGSQQMRRDMEDRQKLLDQESPKKLRAFQPTGNLLEDLDNLYKIQGYSLGIVFTETITGNNIADWHDPKAIYEYFNTPKTQTQRQAESKNELEILFKQTLERTLAAYETKQK